VISVSLEEQAENNVVVPDDVTNCRKRTFPLLPPLPPLVFTHAVTLVTLTA